jgi:antitoxin YefM
MDSVSYTTARAELARVMDRVCDNHEPLAITRQGRQSVVLLSLDDYESMEETAYLMRSPENARRLVSAIADLEKGQGTERQLAE